MQTQTVHTDKKAGSFFFLLFLTGFFILLEISFFIQSNKAYLSDVSVVTDALHIPLSILPGVLYFLFAQLAVHFVYCILIWMVTTAIANLLRLSANQTVNLGIGIWLLGLFTVLAANQYFFPNSKFSELNSYILINRSLLKIVFACLLAMSMGCLFLALISLVKFLFSSRRLCYTSIALLCVLAISIIFYENKVPMVHDAATETKPNIILIGVDSLRPDFLSFFGSDQSTPFFDKFLNQSTVFGEAITPLARTFPSWTGVLTGQYPKQTGVRFDLAKQDKVNTKIMLSSLLQRDGYETIFATDETRFSNIDTHYGFDHIISPPTGLNDFLLGTFNDFPLSNLIVNTIIGKWLFPYSYANRPVYFTYYPRSFLNLMRPTLEKNRTKPLFLAVHFCLPHTPYLSGGLLADQLNAIERYSASIDEVDGQLRQFFILLKQAHLLDHAIVVLLSDHGEALELPGDRITETDSFIDKHQAIPMFYPPMLDNENINESAGHGTDVLGLTQYRSLLAFRLYGMQQKQIKQVIPGVVSLLDIKPTILNLIHLPQDSSAGRVLSLQKRSPMPLRYLFLESDFSPEAIRTVYPETRKVLLEGVQLFQVNPKTTRLTVKETMGHMIIRSKQFADIYGNWMLALYPQNNQIRMPILINLSNGQWTNNLRSSFAQQSPAAAMLNKLKVFYGKEISKISDTPV